MYLVQVDLLHLQVLHNEGEIYYSGSHWKQ